MYVEQRDAGGYRAWLTDVEPFDAAQTDALLFSWDELLAWPRSGQPAPPPDLRVIGVELPIRPSQRARPRPPAPPHALASRIAFADAPPRPAQMYDGVPHDMVDVSSGSALSQLSEQLEEERRSQN